MAWRDWNTTKKVVSSVCAIVAIALVVTFVVLFTRPKPATPDTSSPETSASPLPTYQCTTAEGSQCTKDLAEKEAARDKAYADAEKALRTYNAELAKARQAGGADKVPADLQKVLSPRMQADVLDELKLYKTIKIYAKGETKLVRVAPAREPEWPTDKVAFEVCLDATKLVSVNADTDEPQGHGTFAEGTMSMTLGADGHWVLDGMNLKEAEGC